jgi:PAS domain S-box-containing protein
VRAEAIPVLVVASITLYEAAYHGLLYARGRGRREDLTFSLACFAIGAYDLFCVGLYSATTPHGGVYWQHLQSLTLSLSAIAVMWFVVDYASLRSTKAAQVLTAVFLLLMLASSLGPIQWTWSDLPSVKLVNLPFGHHIVYHEMAPNWLSLLLCIQGLAVFGYQFRVALDLRRQDERPDRGGALLLALLLLFVGFVNDAAVYSGLYTSVYLVEYAYLGLVLLMAHSLAEDLVRAAAVETSLRQSNQALETLFEASPAAIVAFDAEGCVTLWNNAAERMFGYSGDEVDGKPYPLAPGELHDVHLQLLRRALAGGVFDGVELRRRRKDGGFVDVSVSGAPLRDVDGSVRGGMAIIEDITERKRTERALRESEERYRQLVEAMGEGLAILDEDGVLTYVNRRFIEMTGYAPNRLLGHEAAEFYIDISDGRLRSERARLRQGQIGHYQISWRAADGHEVPTQMSVAPLFNERGAYIGSFSVVTDLTEFNAAQRALEQSERQFREMTALLPDAVYEADADLRLTYLNRAGLELFGCAEDDLATGINLRDILSPEQFDAARAGLKQAAETGTSTVGEYVLRRRDGSTAPCELHSAAISNGGGEPAGFRGIARDTSDRVQAEQAQRLAVVGQLAAGVAHEFNNVLAAMSGRAQLAQRTGDSQQVEKLIDVVLKSCARGADICQNLTRFARPQEPRRTPTVVEDLVEAALAMAARAIANADVIVERDYGADVGRIYVDPGQLEQVLLNLVINACHAMPNGGVLTVSTRRLHGRAGECVAIGVTDTGIGIAPEHLPHIFEPFFTTKAPREGNGAAGTGLGLSVSHGLVTANEGSIAVTSEPGAGTQFELRFALHAGAPEAPSTPPPAAAPSVGRAGDCRVLLVEDELQQLGVVSEYLGARGYNVNACASVPEAISAMQAQQFDLIISDLMMPSGGGRAVIEAARRLLPPPPALIVTGRIGDDIDDEVHGMGAEKCLHKPVRLEVLMAAIEEVLAARDS